MVTHFIVDPMEYIYEDRSVTRYKRDVHPPAAIVFAGSADKVSDPSSTTNSISERILIISAAAVGSLLLVAALILFYVCMNRRRASHRIGQLQEFMPTFMDEKATEEYFRKQTTTISSASTLVPPPTNVHHRTRSAPVAFVKGAHKNQSSKSREDRGEQFQQISLAEGTYAESEDEIALKQSLSSGSRSRASTVSVPTPTLHRSVSLNHHGNSGYISRSPPIDEEGAHDASDTDALPTSTNLRFSEGDVLSRPSTSRDHVNSNRFSASMGYHSHRGSTSSAMEFDPSQFTTTSVMFDSRRHPARPGADSSDESDDDDTVSTTSSDGFDHLPAHQKHQNFETHSSYFGGGEKLELEEDGSAHGSSARNRPPPHHNQQSITYTAPRMMAPARKVEGLAFRKPAPPLPSRIMLPHVEGEIEMKLAPDDIETEEERHV